MESCSKEGVLELKPGGCDRVDSDRDIECSASLSSSGAVGMRENGLTTIVGLRKMGPLVSC